jgi:hypothetical protein
MPNKLVKTPYDDWTYRIISHAMAVHRKRGPGCRTEAIAEEYVICLTT